MYNTIESLRELYLRGCGPPSRDFMDTLLKTAKSEKRSSVIEIIGDDEHWTLLKNKLSHWSNNKVIIVDKEPVSDRVQDALICDCCCCLCDCCD